MSSESENAVLYSLKDIPSSADEETPSERANIRPNTASGLGNDSTSSLLAGILDETALDAEEEERRVQEELQRKAREEQAERRRVEERKLAEAERRLQEEAERQRHAHRQRTNMIRAIEGPSEEELAAQARAEEEAKRRAEMETKLAEAERARKQAEQKAAAAAREAQMREQQRLDALAANPAPAAHASSGSRGLLIGAAAFAVVLLLGTVAVGAIMLNDKNQQVSGATFSKTTYKASTVASAFTEQGFVAIPKKEKEKEVEEEDSKAGRRGRFRRGRGARGKTSGGDKKSNRKFDFGGGPFGGGGKGSGIVF